MRKITKPWRDNPGTPYELFYWTVSAPSSLSLPGAEGIVAGCAGRPAGDESFLAVRSRKLQRNPIPGKGG